MTEIALNPTALCPCQSDKSYGQCCQPFHQYRAFPDTAEQLMRSRYCAYTLANIDYIVQTTVPAQQPLLDKAVLLDWATTTHWLGLEILSHYKMPKNHSKVEFNAFFQGQDGKQVHNELSLFVNIDSRWYFVDPTVPLPTMKQPCICGTGKKFKHCCGGLL